jgi:hypothetical protein
VTALPLAMIHVYWFVLPLVVAISLVYAASRHESWPRIWKHALRLCTWILGMLVLTTVILLLINTQV